MLIIRAEQMQAFGQAARAVFTDQMQAHLERFSPPLARTIGSDGLRRVIDFGIRQASRYGLETRGPVRLYLELMLLFGSRFDTDPQYPWAAAALAQIDALAPTERADRLYEQTLEYRAHVAGPDDRFALQALRRIASLAVRLPDPAAAPLVSRIAQTVAAVYPQKAAYLGAGPLHALICEGIEQTKAHGLPPVRGTTLMVALMFAFGHGCADDPLYPWIGRTLREPLITDSEARAKRLERKALVWLEHVLGNFPDEPPR